MHETDIEAMLSSLELKSVNHRKTVCGELVTFCAFNYIAVLAEGRRLFDIEIDDIDADKEIVKYFSFTNMDLKTDRDIDIFNLVDDILQNHESLADFLESFGCEYIIETLFMRIFRTEEWATMPVVAFVPIKEDEEDEESSDDDDDLPDDDE